MVADVAVGIVVQIVSETPRLPVQADRLVDRTAVPFTGPPIVQPQLEVWIPVGTPDPAAEIVRDPGNAIAPGPGFRREQRPDFVGQRRGHPFVGVQGQDPVVRRDRGGVVLLRAEPRPGSDLDPIGVPTRDRDGVVGALGVDDDDLVRPAHRRQRRLDIRRFVPGDDRNGQLRHGGQCTIRGPCPRPTG
jgi:hypothetical protein